MSSFDVETFVSSDVVSRHPRITNDLESRIVSYIKKRMTEGSKFDITNPLVIADIGCGNGEFTKQLIKHKLPKEIGSIIPYLIDPYGNKEIGIQTLNDIDFSNKFPSNHCDLIICKGVVHLFSNFFNFLKNCQRILKPGGMLIIVHMSDEIDFPWGQYAQKSFDLSVKADSFQWVGYDELQQNNFNKSSANLIKNCVVNHFRFKQSAKVPKREWIKFIETRSWSTLQSLNDEQIEDCLEFVNDKYKNKNNVEIDIKWIVTECKKHKYMKQQISKL